MMLLVR